MGLILCCVFPPLKAMEKEERKKVDDAVAFGKASPLPPPEALLQVGAAADPYLCFVCTLYTDLGPLGFKVCGKYGAKP